jgi:hypothetical protein
MIERSGLTKAKMKWEPRTRERVRTESSELRAEERDMMLEKERRCWRLEKEERGNRIIASQNGVAE